MNYSEVLGTVARYRDGERVRYGVVRAAHAGMVLVETNGVPVHVPWAAVERFLPIAFLHLTKQGEPEDVDNEQR